MTKTTTCLARHANLAEYTRHAWSDLVLRARSGDDRARKPLLELFGLFASEYDYRPVNADDVPYAAFALRYAASAEGRFLFNHGAIQSLERLLALALEDSAANHSKDAKARIIAHSS